MPDLEIVERGNGWLTLGVDENDEYRVLVEPTTDDQEDAGEEGMVSRVYPCRRCRWERSCEECHS